MGRHPTKGRPTGRALETTLRAHQNFGAGGETVSGPQAQASYAFDGAGDFVVTLTVGDGTDVDSASQTVRCKQRGKNGIVCS